jgi:CubicO group peptidase (beta-lactamase class C family)
MKKICFILWVFGIIVNTVCAQTAKINLPDDSVLIDVMQKEKVFALGIGVIEEGKIKETKVLGQLSAGLPAPQNTLFQVASLTKPIVEITTLRLVSQGLWSLDEPLYHYWTDPDVSGDLRSKLLTTRHVLAHQTGFVNWRWLHPTGKLTFDFEPGTKTQYSGEGLEYLKKTLEVKFNMPLQEIVSRYLFIPDGMTDSRFIWDDSLIEKRYAVGHNGEGVAYEIRKNRAASAADLLMTTIRDYTVFGAGVLKKKGLTDSVWEDMIRIQSNGQHARYGLGWEVFNDLDNGEFALLHGGSDPGVRTTIVLLPKSKRGLVIFTSSDNGMALIKYVISKSLNLGNHLIEKAK